MSIRNERPLLLLENLLRKIEEILDYREPFYEEADIMVETEGKTLCRLQRR